MRLDDDLIPYFKKRAGEKKIGYHPPVNAALPEYVQQHAIDIDRSNGVAPCGGLSKRRNAVTGGLEVACLVCGNAAGANYSPFE